ncbi:MAG: S8 family serine peptidase, partial [Elusimicrobiota bacterium]
MMAAAGDAMKGGADVVSLSLGSPGGSDAPLAEFFSNLMRQKNSAGESPIGTGSAGNSGPFNRTLSQPSVGVNMISVAAAAKSLEDKEPEIAFYSSVGPALDGRFSMKRLRLKPEITALGGDVTTPPGVKDVYEHGIESAKSKDMAPGSSDAADGKHTRMSGTSMSNPMIAGIALLVKQSVKLGAAAGTAAYRAFMENLPFSVKMILMASSVDMRVPVFFQGAGFVDALAAVRLAAHSFGSSLLRAPIRMVRTALAAVGLAAAPAAAAPAAYQWIGRVQAVLDAEDRVYDAAEEAKKAELGRLVPGKGEGHPEAPSDPQEEAPTRGEAGAAAGKAMAASFNEARGGE